MSPAPPRVAERLVLLAARHRSDAESVAGDLAEEFATEARRTDPTRARAWYWRQALALIAHFLVAPRTPRWRSNMPSPIDAPTGRWHLDLGQDLRAAWRAVWQQPAVSATIVLALALGLAANATIFALGDALVLRPFRFAGVDRTVLVASASDADYFFERQSVTPGDFVEWTERTTDTFSALAGIQWWNANLSGQDLPEQIGGFRVSPSFFSILDVVPALGRTFTPDDARPGAPRVVVLSHGLWVRRFGADPTVVGRVIQLDGEPTTIAGVAPKGFASPYGSAMWAPLALSTEARLDRISRMLMVVGRLRDGVGLDAARARMQSIVADQRRAYPATNAKREVTVRTYAVGFGDPGAPAFIGIWQAAALLLLLVAAANVVNLLLARGVERQREFAIRLAVGAGRGRIVYQQLLEGMLLAAAAVPLAVALAWAAVEAARTTFPPAIVRFVSGWDYLHVQPATLVVTAVLATLVTMAASLVPALKASRAAVVDELRQGSRLTAGSGRQRLRLLLATLQIALTVALLTAAGLTIAAVQRVTTGPLGFTPAGVLTATLTLPVERYPTPEAQYAFAARVLDRLRALPSVNVAAVSSVLPYGNSLATTSFWTETMVPTSDTARDVSIRTVTPGWADALRVPLLRGRALSDDDRPDTLQVAVVSDALARRFWPGEDAIGRRFRLARDSPLITVVGTVGDIPSHWLIKRDMSAVYRPLAQAPTGSFAIVLRVAGDPADLGAAVRAAVAALDAQQPVASVRTYPQLIADTTFGIRFAARALVAIALVAMLVSIVGVYSLIAYLASRRSRELGVRVALGATREQIVRLTVGQGLRIAVAGTVLGVALAAILGRVLERSLFGVVAANYVLAAVIAVVFGLVAVAASYPPARRAAAVDPLVALWTE